MNRDYYLPSGRMCLCDIRSEARELMARSGNRLTLCVAEIFIMVMTMAALIIISYSDSLLSYFGYSMLPYVSELILAAVIILLILPISLGINKITFLQCKGERAYSADVFSALRILPRTWLVQLIMAFPLIICAGGAYTAYHLSEVMLTFAIIERGTLMCPIMVAAAVAVGLIIVLGGIALYLRMYFFAAYAMRGDMGVFKALGASFRATRGREWKIIGFLLGFAGWGILSLLSFGVLHLLHTAPYYNTAYMIFADSSEDRNV